MNNIYPQLFLFVALGLTCLGFDHPQPIPIQDLRPPQTSGSPYEVLKGVDDWLNGIKDAAARRLECASARMQDGGNVVSELDDTADYFAELRELVVGQNGIDKNILALEKDINAQVASLSQLLHDPGTSSATRHSITNTLHEAEQRRKDISLCIGRINVITQNLNDARNEIFSWKKYFNSSSAISGRNSTVREIVDQINVEIEKWRNRSIR